MMNTQIMHNPIDVVIDGQGNKIVMRGNQRLVSLRAMGYTDPIPYRIWDSVGDIPRYIVPETIINKDKQLLRIFPKEHVRSKRIFRLPTGQVSVLPKGALTLSRKDYNIIKDQISSDDYIVVDHNDDTL